MYITLISMQDLIEAAKNDDITTVEHILRKEEDISSIVDARESDKVNSILINFS
jgi:hypothetical protein